MRSDDQDGQQERPIATTLEPGEGDAAVPIEEPRLLFFRCAGTDCAASLAALREVLPQCPAALPLPHSPPWFLGVFALRAELVGLADPAPLLFDFDSPTGHAPVAAPPAHGVALLVGTGAQTLAWVVESIGATAPLALSTGDDEADGVSVVDMVGGNPNAPESTVAAAYARGTVMRAGGRGQRYVVIDVEALLADMLRALEERSANP